MCKGQYVNFQNSFVPKGYNRCEETSIPTPALLKNRAYVCVSLLFIFSTDHVLKSIILFKWNET